MDRAKEVSRTPSVIRIQVTTPPAKSMPNMVPRLVFKPEKESFSAFFPPFFPTARAMLTRMTVAQIYRMPAISSMNLKPRISASQPPSAGPTKPTIPNSAWVTPNILARFSSLDCSAMKASKLGPTSAPGDGTEGGGQQQPLPGGGQEQGHIGEDAHHAADGDGAQATERVRDPAAQDLQGERDDGGDGEEQPICGTVAPRSRM